MLSQRDKPGFFNNAWRTICRLIDKVFFLLLAVIYEVLFNVATANIISGKTMQAFYGRIQLLVGVIMLFVVAVSLLSGIVNPGTLTDEKQGFGSVIKRIVFMVVMLGMLVPINPNSATTNYSKMTYADQIADNGILFGTLYELQYIVLSKNTIARIILPNASSTFNESDDDIKSSAKDLAATIARSFVTVNAVDENSDPHKVSGRLCDDQQTYDNFIVKYQSTALSASEIIDLTDAVCINTVGEKHYVFAYGAPMALVSAVFLCFVLGVFTIDIAVRTIKLSVLRLIAPIPIISYISPNSEKKGTFAAWTSTLMNTYLDLFIRLAAIYFVTFLLQEIRTNGIAFFGQRGFAASSPFINIISGIIIIIGLFIFARLAPSFIIQALGFKGNISNFGLKGALAGTAALTRGAGLSGAIQASRQSVTAGIEAERTGKAAPTVFENIQMGQKYAQDLESGNLKEPLSAIDRRLQRNAQNRVLRKIDATDNDVELRKARMIDAKGRSASMNSVNEALQKGGSAGAAEWAHRHIDANGHLLDNEGNLMYDANGNLYDLSAYVTGRDSSGRVSSVNWLGVSEAMSGFTNQAEGVADDEERGFEKIKKARDAYGPGETARDKYNSRRNRNMEADRMIERDRMRDHYGINEHSLGGSRETDGGAYRAGTAVERARNRQDLRDSRDPRFSSGMRDNNRNRIRMDQNNRDTPNSDGHR